jgi:plastocyanin
VHISTILFTIPLLLPLLFLSLTLTTAMPSHQYLSEITTYSWETQQQERLQLNQQHQSANYNIVIPMGAAWREIIVNRFDPSNITIPVGSEVIWSNQDKLSHTVTSGNASIGADGKFNSNVLLLHDSFSYIFSQPGRYSYYCIMHPWMKGMVTVSDSDSILLRLGI